MRRRRERPIRRRCPPRVARLVSGEDVEQVRGVLDRARERSGGREALERPVGRRRDAAARRLEPEEPAARRRDANRASAVCRVRGGNEARGECCSCAAARTAGRELRVPGVPGHAVELRLGEGDGSELGRVRLADDDESGIADATDDRAVEVGDVVGVRARGERRADPRGGCEVLHADRDAAKRRVARGRVDQSRSGEGLLGADGDEGVEGRDRAARSDRARLARARSTRPRRCERVAPARRPRGTRAPSAAKLSATFGATRWVLSAR